MNAPPKQFNGAQVICYAKITEQTKPTGNTVHRKGGEVLGPANGLVICQYADDSGFYLLYCDEAWEEMTDTWHMNLDDAKDQAEFEYEGVSKFWVEANR